MTTKTKTKQSHVPLPKSQQTTLYLPEDLRARLRTCMYECNLDNRNAFIEAAIDEKLQRTGKGY